MACIDENHLRNFVIEIVTNMYDKPQFTGFGGQRGKTPQVKQAFLRTLKKPEHQCSGNFRAFLKFIVLNLCLRWVVTILIWHPKVKKKTRQKHLKMALTNALAS